jgi:hypothetical protein
MVVISPLPTAETGTWQDRMAFPRKLDGAGPALSNTAAILGPGKIEQVPQDPSRGISGSASTVRDAPLT